MQAYEGNITKIVLILLTFAQNRTIMQVFVLQH